MNSFKEKSEKKSSFLRSPFFGLANSQAKTKKNHFCDFKNGFFFCGEFFFGLANFQDPKKHSLKVEKKIKMEGGDK